MHVLTGNDVSGSSGKFHKLVVDDISARKITSGVSTSEFFEVPQKQYIPFASGSAGADAEGAGLQIGGTAGSGSAGVASIVLGDAGSGAGKDLLFKDWNYTRCIFEWIYKRQGSEIWRVWYALCFSWYIP